MTAVSAIPNLKASPVRARRAGFLADVSSIAGRALRGILREPEFVLPAIVIPLFFFAVNSGALSSLTESTTPGFDYNAFIVPACIIFGVTGIPPSIYIGPNAFFETVFDY
jgi:ABC-2 type transport system permease protein